MNDTTLTFSGLNGATGKPLFQDLAAPELARRLQTRWRSGKKLTYRGPREGVDPQRLDSAGWGVVFLRDAGSAVRAAMEPLLARRREEAGDLYRELAGPSGFRPGESKWDFLERLGVGAGPTDTAIVPYYLLFVGGPEEIPFCFQRQFQMSHAVGRIAFERPDDYARYAETVVAAERGEGRPRDRGLLLFGPCHAGDPATELAARHLLAPLAERCRASLAEAGFSVGTVDGEAAGRERLARLLGDGDSDAGRPALLFLSGHGLGFDAGHPDQVRLQGSPVCQDWPGPEGWRGPLTRDHYLAADDLPEQASPTGAVVFHLACYGAGTPRHDSFPQGLGRVARPIAPRPFLARLPQRLLGASKGGALAYVAQVDRAWSSSFVWRTVTGDVGHIEDAFRRLAGGARIGHALETFGQRAADLSNALLEEQQKVWYGHEEDPLEVARLWTASVDARQTVLLGDPAVRLPLG